MVKFFFKKGALGAALAAMLLNLGSTPAEAIGWPANHQGVMLQGFYWDSYSDTKWTNLESQADELSQYFNLIWVPNSGFSGGGNQMGYMPIYWFTNHKSSFGTEEQLLSMIKTFKSKGTGIIADCVINHRNGVSNWTNFPKEEWNGQTWYIGPEGICSTDEVRNESGQARPTGASDTGEDFNGARDLDHTNANVQNNCKNYVKCLQEKYGYAGMRYDMVKGYGGQYTKIYNQYANVQYSVGEYWDGNYDKVAGWIDATGKTSAAFDFPGKYAINEAFASNDMSKLCWMANGSTPQPAGMIHYGYTQYAVTFVDNHDTYRDGSKFNGNVVAANAFILMSPGTPCVFLPHYKQNKAAIQTLINIRNSCGIHNMSAVTVLRHDRDCYMAEITGTKGKAVVKIGSAMASPSGYSDSDIKASGNGYCVWTKVNVQGGNGSTITPGGGGNGGGSSSSAPSQLYLMGNIKGASWSTSSSPAMTKEGNCFTITAQFEAAAGETYCYFNLTDALGADWDELNAVANRYGASTEGVELSNPGSAAMQAYLNGIDASGCQSWKILPGTYKITADFDKMTINVGEYNTGNQGGNQGGGNDNPGGGGNQGGGSTVDMPSQLYLIGNIQGASWSTSSSPAMTKENNCFTTTATFVAAAGETYCFFNLSDALGADWDELNAIANRYGAATEGVELSNPGSAAMQAYLNNIDASGCQSWKILPGTYKITADFEKMTINVGEYNTGNQGGNQGGGNDNPGGGGNQGGDTPANMPSQLYLIGDIDGCNWNTAASPAMTKNGNTYVLDVTFAPLDPTATKCYFNLSDALGADWDELNAIANRYGAAEEGVAISYPGSVPMVVYENNINASGCLSWVVAPGTYKVVANFSNMTVSIAQPGTNGVENLVTDEGVEIWFNMLGEQVENPHGGVFIRMKNGKASKVLVP